MVDAPSPAKAWGAALSLHAWERVVDRPGLPATDLIGGSPRSACVRVAAERGDGLAPVRAADALGQLEHWAVMVDSPRLHPDDVAAWAHAHATYLCDGRTGRLVRVPGGLVDLAAFMLEAGWLDPTGCLMVSPATADEIARQG